MKKSLIHGFLAASILLLGVFVVPISVSAGGPPPTTDETPQECISESDPDACVGDEFVGDGEDLPAGQVGICDDNTILGLPAWYKYLELDPEDCSVVGPAHYVEGVKGEASHQLDMPEVVARVAIAIVEILLRVASVVAVGFVSYGGFRYITSQGDPEAAKTARQTIINALVGLLISLIAAQLVGFIAGKVL